MKIGMKIRYKHLNLRDMVPKNLFMVLLQNRTISVYPIFQTFPSAEIAQKKGMDRSTFIREYDMEAGRQNVLPHHSTFLYSRTFSSA